MKILCPQCGYEVPVATFSSALGSIKSAAKSEASRRNGQLHRSVYDWGSVDWSKSDAQISKSVGANRITVWRHRKRIRNSTTEP
jgi:hypothetical protein